MTPTSDSWQPRPGRANSAAHPPSPNSLCCLTLKMEDSDAVALGEQLYIYRTTTLASRSHPCLTVGCDWVLVALEDVVWPRMP
ncbi:hypothetical protein E2C01_064305 [Portunus trituberculatus]|uniref:Uncharacterized protein n=1 Tax=Portunus trituberculatus TaxID=210409 RepID=A0A5B7HMV7_PORTR|nr:hypothetical protein [Portunus trituberculatus]